MDTLTEQQPKTLVNRFSGNKCKLCRAPQEKGILILWHGKGNGITCMTCAYKDHYPTPETTVTPTESEEQDMPQEVSTPVEDVRLYGERSVDELRKLCRERGLNGTTLLSLGKVQLVEFLQTGSYTPKDTPKTAETQVNAAPTNGHNALEEAIRQIAASVTPKFDIPQVMTEAEIKAYLDEQVGKFISKPTVINLPESKSLTLDHDVHEQFASALRAAKIHGNVLLVGPAGTGKTTIAEHIAEALELPYGAISCTAGMSEGHLLGRMNASGEYIESEFVRLYENGGVFCFDEFDAMDSNTALVINSALANGHLPVPNRKDKPSAKRHASFYAIACANTFGTANSIEYAGRNQLDAATLDRFGGGLSRFFVDYDLRLETKIAGRFVKELDAIRTIRRKVAENKLRRIVGTRAVIAMTKELEAGSSFQAVKEALLLGWSDTEKAKVN